MKIFCVGRNYSGHIRELKNETPSDPVIFLKPDTAILKNNAPLYYPEFSKQIDYEAELVFRIGKEGKNISEKFAMNYIDGIGIGIDFTARDLQQKAKSKGLPWTLAKGFNGAAPVSEIFPLTKFQNIRNINFSLKKNGADVQKGNSSQMIFPIEKIISYISGFILIKKGDLVFTGTPEGTGSIQRGDKLEGYIENEKLLEVEIK
jgi:2-keto-4-pentenoate hydratase/2-oxohepta-3-ene-1,7-dioic acid hydratase in catechol pathway